MIWQWRVSLVTDRHFLKHLLPFDQASTDTEVYRKRTRSGRNLDARCSCYCKCTYCITFSLCCSLVAAFDHWQTIMMPSWDPEAAGNSILAAINLFANLNYTCSLEFGTLMRSTPPSLTQLRLQDFKPVHVWYWREEGACQQGEVELFLSFYRK